MAELEDMSPTVYPDGSVIGSLDASGNLPENPELLHRPHAFALMHGDDGAKVAYGQLLWRIDVLELELSSAGGEPVTGAGQDAISVFNTKVPTIDAADGDAMDAGINNTKYHQLDGYGDVYLYWTTDLAEATMADRVNACWVQVDGPAEDELDAVLVNFTNMDRMDASDTCPSDGQKEGTYRVKLGTVNEDEQVIQNHSSDVFWSIFLLKRTGGTSCH